MFPLSAKYEVLDETGAVIGTEEFQIREDQDGYRASCELDSKRPGTGNGSPTTRFLEMSARLSRDWEVQSLDFLIRIPRPECRVLYSWDDGAWIGLLRSPGGEEIRSAWPMSRGMQPVFPCALSDALLLRRSALGPYSQKRLELLEVGELSLETTPSYALIDRLGSLKRDFPTGTVDADRYRWVDACGNSCELWTNRDGIVLEKQAHDGRTWKLLGAQRQPVFK